MAARQFNWLIALFVLIRAHLWGTAFVNRFSVQEFSQLLLSAHGDCV
jgi:hypothetical protein